MNRLLAIRQYLSANLQRQRISWRPRTGWRRSRFKDNASKNTFALNTMLLICDLRPAHLTSPQ